MYDGFLAEIRDRTGKFGWETALSHVGDSFSHNVVMLRAISRNHPLNWFDRTKKRWRLIPFRTCISAMSLSEEMVVSVDGFIDFIIRDIRWNFDRQTYGPIHSKDMRKELGYRTRTYKFGRKHPTKTLLRP